MELTQEYFDKSIGNLLEIITATKEDVAAVKEDVAAVRADLVAQTKELKAYTHEAFEVQQIWMEERFKELITKYDMRERVEKLEKEFMEWKLRGTAHAH